MGLESIVCDCVVSGGSAVVLSDPIDPGPVARLQVSREHIVVFIVYLPAQQSSVYRDHECCFSLIAQFPRTSVLQLYLLAATPDANVLQPKLCLSFLMGLQGLPTAARMI